MKKSYALIAVVCGLALTACGGGSGSSNPNANTNSATVSASLMDAPFRTAGGTVTAVNILVSKAELIGGGAPQTIATFSPAKAINLLDFQTTALQLGSAAVPAGQYQQLRLILDTSSSSNTSVVINGTTYPLRIPSATGAGGFGNNTSTDNGNGAGTSGIKVNINLMAVAGAIYAYLIDFNAAESIVQTGNGNYLMKPVLVATAQNIAGSISGAVKNAAGGVVSNAQVLAQQNGVTVNSGVTDSSGNFTIEALPAGSYTLVVNNAWTNLAGASETATGADGTASVTAPATVTVTAGQTATVTITD
ncbi:MAG: DUF4382 domain-containing protein [Candidatus Baltobacteraceae bacterium]